MNRTPHILLLASALVLLALSCRDNTLDTPGHEGAEISFTPVKTKAITAATEIGAFSVWGTMQGDGATDYITIFSGTGVHQTSPGVADWTYDNTRYWIPGNFFRFYALHPSGTAATLTSDKSILISNYEPEAHQSQERDLMSAYHDRLFLSGDVATTVQLHFQHLLCRVRVKITTTLPEDMSSYNTNDNITIKRVVISGVRTKANCTINAPITNTDSYTATWSNPSVIASSHIYTFPTAIAENTLGLVGGNPKTELFAWGEEGFYAIPQGTTGLLCEITYRLAGDTSDRNKVSILPNLTWRNNMIYTYPVNIQANYEIVFGTPVVESWGEEQRGATIVIK